MPECDSGKKEGMPVDMRTYIGKDKKLECETIRSFCGTCETVHEYIRSDSPQFKKQSEEKIRKAIDDFREEVVEAVKNGYIPLTHVSIVENAKDTVCEIIRTHRKETE